MTVAGRNQEARELDRTITYLIAKDWIEHHPLGDETLLAHLVGESCQGLGLSDIAPKYALYRAKDDGAIHPETWQYLVHRSLRAMGHGAVRLRAAGPRPAGTRTLGRKRHPGNWLPTWSRMLWHPSKNAPGGSPRMRVQPPSSTPNCRPVKSYRLPNRFPMPASFAANLQPLSPIVIKTPNCCPFSSAYFRLTLASDCHRSSKRRTRRHWFQRVSRNLQVRSH